MLCYYTGDHKRLIIISVLVIGEGNNKDSGYLIYNLGKDTTMIGYYEVKGDLFTSTILTRSTVAVHKVKGKFLSNGELESTEGYTYTPVIGKDSIIVQTAKLYIDKDTTFIEQNAGGKVSVQKYPVKTMMVAGFGPYV